MSGVEINRTIVIIDHLGRQIYCGWTFHEGDLHDDYTPFGSIEGLELFLEDAKNLTPDPESATDYNELDWEWAVALTLIHQVGGDDAWNLGQEQLEAWQEWMFDDTCSEEAEAFPEKLREMTWDEKYGCRDALEKEIKALNMHLYLSEPSEAAKRAARRLGLTLKPENGRLSLERQGEPATADTG